MFLMGGSVGKKGRCSFNGRSFNASLLARRSEINQSQSNPPGGKQQKWGARGEREACKIFKPGSGLEGRVDLEVYNTG